MDDLISRQAVKELAHNQIREKYCGMALKEQRDFYIKLADSIIDLLPSAEPQERKGKWVYQIGMIECDQCLRAIRRIDHDGILNFCPNCGARME